MQQRAGGKAEGAGWLSGNITGRSTEDNKDRTGALGQASCLPSRGEGLWLAQSNKKEQTGTPILWPTPPSTATHTLTPLQQVMPFRPLLLRK